MIRLAFYYLLHLVTRRPVVIVVDHYGEEHVRLVRRSLSGAYPTVTLWISPQRLLRGGGLTNSLHGTDRSLVTSWHPLYGEVFR